MSIEAAPRRLPRWIGLAGFVFAVLLIVLEGVAIGIASNRDWSTATTLAWAVIVLMVVSFLCGLAAVIRRLGRRWGVAAMVLSVVGNPLVLVWLFALIGNS
jgi:hypothetical protein